MSVGSAFTRGRPRASSDRPCSAEALVNSVDSLEHTPSTQWSTARMPVDRNSHIGVWRVTSGSRITACGMVSGWRNISFTLVASLVTPARPENSPADRVVGIEICRTVGGLTSAPCRGSCPSPSTLRDVVGEAELDRLGAVGDRAAAQGDDQIGLGLARLRGGGDHGRARRVRRHLVEGADAFVAERAPDLLDLVGLAIERAAHHQEHALGAVLLDQLGHRLGGRLAVVDFFHLGKNDAPRCQHSVLPDPFFPPQRSWGGGPQGRRGHERIAMRAHDPSARCAGTSPREMRAERHDAICLLSWLETTQGTS